MEIEAIIKDMNKNSPRYRLLDAILYCNQRVNEIAVAHSDMKVTKSYFASIVKYIRDNVIVVRLTVPNEANAFKVFETLNDRGLDLSAVDLLKNHLFGLAHDQSKERLTQIENRWVRITQELKHVKEDEFLKVYWTSRYGRTQLDEIFDDVKERFKTGDQAIDLSIDLLKTAEQYVALDVPADVTWSKHTDNVKDAIGAFVILGSKQVRAPILAAYEKLEGKNFEQVLKLLEAVIVRWQVIGGRRTGAIEIALAKLAEQIWTGAIKNGYDAKRIISDVYLDDAEFRADFETKDDLSSQKAVYLLRKIEEHESKQSNKSKTKDAEPKKTVTLEHIFPRNPGSGWKVELAKEPKLVEHVSYIGNLCLLSSSRNRRAGQSDFSSKKKIYAESGLITTSAVADVNEWGIYQIKHRQAWLAKKAVVVWSFP